jgi:acyl carrier protein
MEHNEILKSLNGLFIEVLDNHDITLKNETTADDIEGWDSLTHIHLVSSIEKYFKIRFATKEILSWNNVGEMIIAINNKIG